MNQEVKMSGDDKASILLSLRDCKAKLEESELLRERLASRMDTLLKKIESEEGERDGLMQQVDRLNEKVHTTKFSLTYFMCQMVFDYVN